MFGESMEAKLDGVEWWAEVCSHRCEIFFFSFSALIAKLYRSLIALSLILALLQFKPAPMYILDEVDAALDLSHTQNIGRLIKTRFQGSQFIVVSLKDGMFQNANRVFRTRFSEGTSVVSVMTPGELK